MSFCVAIDGPAAAGKGTIARAISKHFGFAHLDTGLLYRAVGFRHLQGEDATAAAKSLRPEDLENPDRLRRPEIADAASRVAVLPDVRSALVDFQRSFARRAGGAVLDGRDIGTVICPDAAVKLFVTATPEARAERRYAELVQRGIPSDRETVLADVRARDARDAERSAAPMTAAPDATQFDTTTLDIAAATAQAITLVSAAYS